MNFFYIGEFFHQPHQGYGVIYHFQLITMQNKLIQEFLKIFGFNRFY
jgi:hypothetical protein